MPANAPVDPSATANTVTLLNYLWALTTSGATSGKCLTGTNLSSFDEVAAGGFFSPFGLAPEYQLFKSTTGFSPAVLGVTETSVAASFAVYDNYGREEPVWGLAHGALVEHARKGGILHIGHVFPTTPSNYATTTTAKITSQFGAGTWHISDIATAGVLDVTNVLGFTSGKGLLVATPSGGVTTLYPFTYTTTSTGVLHGVAFAAGVPPTAVVANLAPVSTNQLTTYIGALQTAAQGGAWPLQYSSSAYTALGGTVACDPNGTTTLPAHSGASFLTIPVCIGDFVTGVGVTAGTTVTAIASSGSITVSNAITSGTNVTLTFTCGQSTDWAGAQAVNANGNLNAMLDYLITEANALGALGIPVMLRLAPEMNGSTFWWCAQSARNAWWYARFFAYCAGYITGQQVFAGQPVSATPAHNVIFVHNVLSTACTQWQMPSVNGVVYADIISGDYYHAGTMSTMLSVQAGFAGYGNCPTAMAEVSGSTSANTVVYGTLSNTGDLSLLSSGSTLTISGTMNGTPAASGTLLVPCSNGLQSVTYSSVSGNVFTLSSTAGVPAGSMMLGGTSAVLTSFTGITNDGAAALVTKLKATNASWYATWSVGNNQLYYGSYVTLCNNAWFINREQLPVMPWALPGNMASSNAASSNSPPGPGR